MTREEKFRSLKGIPPTENLDMYLDYATEDILLLTNRAEPLNSLSFERLIFDLAYIYYDRDHSEIAESISTTSQGGVSVTYRDNLPESMLERIAAFRKIKTYGR